MLTSNGIWISSFSCDGLKLYGRYVTVSRSAFLFLLVQCMHFGNSRHLKPWHLKPSFPLLASSCKADVSQSCSCLCSACFLAISSKLSTTFFSLLSHLKRLEKGHPSKLGFTSMGNLRRLEIPRYVLPRCASCRVEAGTCW